MIRTDDNPPGPLDLMESARVKYTLALARLRRGPPELALLSLHGSIEDALRAYALRQHLAAANASFPQLLDTLAADPQALLNSTQADIIRRMHRLRARVAHGEQMTLAAETLDAYHRLVAQLLPHYGVLVVGPDDAAAAPTVSRGEAPTLPVRRRNDDVPAIPPRHNTDHGRTTTRLAAPPRERTAYPDDELAHYTARPRRAPSGYRSAGDDADAVRPRGLQFTQPWVLPLLILVSIFLIGAAITISLQQIRSVRSLVLATATTFVPVMPTSAPQASADARVDVLNPSPSVESLTPTPTLAPGLLVVGRNARVVTQIPLNIRTEPSLAANVALVLQPGTEVLVVDGPVVADGISWWQVRALNIEGWCAGEYLEAQ